MGEKFWGNEEDKAMVEAVVGTEACEFLTSSASENILADLATPPAADLGVRHALTHAVEGTDWNYAIFWQVSRAKSGGKALIWGDGCCRDLKGGEIGDGGSGNREVEKQDEVKKRVLRKLHACFRGSEEDNYLAAARVDVVSDADASNPRRNW